MRLRDRPSPVNMFPEEIEAEIASRPLKWWSRRKRSAKRLRRLVEVLDIQRRLLRKIAVRFSYRQMSAGYDEARGPVVRW